IAILECQFKPEHAEAGTEWLKRVLVATRAFEGCLGVEVIQDHEDPARLLAVEHWASLEHDRAYRAWRAGEGRAQGGADLLAGPMKLTVGLICDDI
ncbi:MAG TPA: antibiotic biosynthesis monooxygenase, partial [Acidimicrobiales bacterium]|nr:antibiotic biosynthesis monooxygenase [Acidimicrobiales bacterium]